VKIRNLLHAGQRSQIVRAQDLVGHEIAAHFQLKYLWQARNEFSVFADPEAGKISSFLLAGGKWLCHGAILL
jgi:hypothetical protein